MTFSCFPLFYASLSFLSSPSYWDRLHLFLSVFFTRVLDRLYRCVWLSFSFVCMSRASSCHFQFLQLVLLAFSSDDSFFIPYFFDSLCPCSFFSHHLNWYFIDCPGHETNNSSATPKTCTMYWDLKKETVLSESLSKKTEDANCRGQIKFI